MKRILLGLLAVPLSLIVPGSVGSQPLFSEQAVSSGLTYLYYPDVSLGTGPGAAFGDWDNDGDMDLYVGRDSQGDLLFQNDGSGNFADVTSLYVPVVNTGKTNGMVWGDVDRDGDLDLFVANEGVSNLFYKNLLTETGSPTLLEATAAFGLGESTVRNAKGASFTDVNADGRLDVYVANYIEDSPYLRRNLLYIQRPDGLFAESSVERGVADEGFGFTGIFTDYDHDGDPDLYVVNDFSMFQRNNRLYRNMLRETGSHDFVDVTAASGDLVEDDGYGMGVAVGDYNQDGDLDIYVTNLTGNDLYRNNGDGTFSEVSGTVGVRGRDDTVSWGTAFVDFDNDGDFELFSVNGFIFNPSEGFGPQTDELFYNQGLIPWSENSGTCNFGSEDQARAAACADIDMDGDVDLLVTCTAQNPDPGVAQPRLYRNQNGNSNEWLGIRLFGTTSNLQGYGARVAVTVGSKVIVQEIHAGSSYLSQHSPWPLFGLGSATVADEVRVEWPSGTVDVASNVPSRQYLSIVEGLGLVAVTLESYSLDYFDGAVQVRWSVHDDGELVGFSLDRREAGTPSFETLSGPERLEPRVRSTYSYSDGRVRPGRTYDYRLRAHKDDGSVEVLANRSILVPPGDVRLYQNEPNPFNPTTVIRYQLALPSNIELSIFDGSGRRIRTLARGIRDSGVQSETWDGRDDSGRVVSSGLYYFRLKTGKTTLTKKLILLK